MERTTIYLDPALKRRLKTAAARRGVAEALLVRKALERFLAEEGSVVVRPVGESADGGVAGRVDEALEELGFGRS